MPAAFNSTYKVGASDVLSIKVFNEDALTNKFVVDSDGTITFPLIGRVQVGGKTTREIEEHLTKLLQPDYVRRAQVSVEIATYRSRSIYVMGEVRTPGRYNIEGPMTLLEVIANAGSTTPTASNTIIVQRYKDGLAAAVSAPLAPGDSRWAEVMRINLDELREGKLSANLLLQDSDMIIVPAAERFYVSGFVKTPGSFVLRPGHDGPPGDRRSRRPDRARLDARHQDHPQGQGRQGSRDRREDVGPRPAERHDPHSPAPDLTDAAVRRASIPMKLIIEPGRAAAHYWRDLWRYRELLYFLAWRDIVGALQADRDRRDVGAAPAGADDGGVRGVPPDGRRAGIAGPGAGARCSPRSCRGSCSRPR